ncbi:CheW-like protein [Humitalea rosea]|uniref:CheW-like protein n=1 Tax=Humitalea rosea TaxID=990373 RepID=A0A2W7IRN9_9PROT|nr:chemotaxis protein CheW [Humitalea rosea]PZW49096.1 CheW-like protein [Humitalea rosea]
MSTPVAALRAAGKVWRLPPGSMAAEAATMRALPAGGVAGLALLAGRAVPVLAPGGAAGSAWAMVPLAGGDLLVTGEALLAEAPAGAPPLPMPDMPPRQAAPPPAPPRLAAPPKAAAPGAVASGALDLISAGGRLRVGLTALRHVVPLPAWRPVPGAPAEVLGWTIADGAPVLVLDPGGMAGGAAHLALLTLGGRLLGIPCARLAPAPVEGVDLSRLAQLVHWAAAAPPEVPLETAATRSLLLVVAGGQRFALPAQDVEAAIAPLRASALPGGAAVIMHKGDVLPVLDAGVLLGGTPVLDGRASPCLRLRLPRPVALAVSAIEALRAVPGTAIAPLSAPGFAIAVLSLNGEAVPVCSAARLGGAYDQ